MSTVANDVQAAINAAGGQLSQALPSPTYRKTNAIGTANVRCPRAFI